MKKGEWIPWAGGLYPPAALRGRSYEAQDAEGKVLQPDEITTWMRPKHFDPSAIVAYRFTDLKEDVALKKGEWITWGGQSDICPVPEGACFEFQIRGDGLNNIKAGHLAINWKWAYTIDDHDIIAYRLINLKEDDEVLTDVWGKPVFDHSKSDGSTASYYELPEGATELQHLISDRDMNAQMGEIFRATYRYGRVAHSEKLRDAKKIKYYAEAEIARLEKLEGNKDV